MPPPSWVVRRTLPVPNGTNTSRLSSLEDGHMFFAQNAGTESSMAGLLGLKSSQTKKQWRGAFWILLVDCCLVEPPKWFPKFCLYLRMASHYNISWCSPHVPSFTSHLLHAILRLCPWAHGPAAEPVLCPVAHSFATGPTFCVANLSNSDGGKECRYVQVSSPILHVNHHIYI